MLFSRWRLGLFGAQMIMLLLSCSPVSRRLTYPTLERLREPSGVKKALLSTVIVPGSQLESYPGDVEVVGKHIVFIEPEATLMIRVFSLEAGKTVVSFGKSGQGPEEFIQPSLVIRGVSGTDTFWIFDSSTNQLREYILDQVLQGETKPRRIIPLYHQGGIPFSIGFSGDGRIFATGTFVSCRIAVFDPDGSRVESWGRVPVHSEDARIAAVHAHGYRGNLACWEYNGELKGVIVATRFGAIIERYTADGRLQAVFNGPDPFLPAYEITTVDSFYTMAQTKDTRFGYLDLAYCPARDVVFLLYSGKSRQQSDHANAGQVLFTWNPDSGQLLDAYELDVPIYDMSVSEDGTKVYGAADDAIVCFHL